MASKQVTVTLPGGLPLGFRLNALPEDEHLFAVSKIRQHSKAEKAGLMQGDVILCVNNVCCEGLSHLVVTALTDLSDVLTLVVLRNIQNPSEAKTAFDNMSSTFRRLSLKEISELSGNPNLAITRRQSTGSIQHLQKNQSTKSHPVKLFGPHKFMQSNLITQNKHATHYERLLSSDSEEKNKTTDLNISSTIPRRKEKTLKFESGTERRHIIPTRLKNIAISNEIEDKEFEEELRRENNLKKFEETQKSFLVRDFSSGQNPKNNPFMTDSAITANESVGTNFVPPAFVKRCMSEEPRYKSNMQFNLTTDSFKHKQQPAPKQATKVSVRRFSLTVPGQQIIQPGSKTVQLKSSGLQLKTQREIVQPFKFVSQPLLQTNNLASQAITADYQLINQQSIKPTSSNKIANGHNDIKQQIHIKPSTQAFAKNIIDSKNLQKSSRLFIRSNSICGNLTNSSNVTSSSNILNSNAFMKAVGQKVSIQTRSRQDLTTSVKLQTSTKLDKNDADTISTISTFDLKQSDGPISSTKDFNKTSNEPLYSQACLNPDNSVRASTNVLANTIQTTTATTTMTTSNETKNDLLIKPSSATLKTSTVSVASVSAVSKVTPFAKAPQISSSSVKQKINPNQRIRSNSVSVVAYAKAKLNNNHSNNFNVLSSFKNTGNSNFGRDSNFLHKHINTQQNNEARDEKCLTSTMSPSGSTEVNLAPQQQVTLENKNEIKSAAELSKVTNVDNQSKPENNNIRSNDVHSKIKIQVGGRKLSVPDCRTLENQRQKVTINSKSFAKNLKDVSNLSTTATANNINKNNFSYSNSEAKFRQMENFRSFVAGDNVPKNLPVSGNFPTMLETANAKLITTKATSSNILTHHHLQNEASNFVNTQQKNISPLHSLISQSQHSQPITTPTTLQNLPVYNLFQYPQISDSSLHHMPISQTTLQSYSQHSTAQPFLHPQQRHPFQFQQQKPQMEEPHHQHCPRTATVSDPFSLPNVPTNTLFHSHCLLSPTTDILPLNKGLHQPHTQNNYESSMQTTTNTPAQQSSLSSHKQQLSSSDYQPLPQTSFPMANPSSVMLLQNSTSVCPIQQSASHQLSSTSSSNFLPFSSSTMHWKPYLASISTPPTNFPLSSTVSASSIPSTSSSAPSRLNAYTQHLLHKFPTANKQVEYARLHPQQSLTDQTYRHIQSDLANPYFQQATYPTISTSSITSSSITTSSITSTPTLYPDGQYATSQASTSQIQQVCPSLAGEGSQKFNTFTQKPSHFETKSFSNLTNQNQQLNDFRKYGYDSTSFHSRPKLPLPSPVSLLSPPGASTTPAQTPGSQYYNDAVLQLSQNLTGDYTSPCNYQRYQKFDNVQHQYSNPAVPFQNSLNSFSSNNGMTSNPPPNTINSYISPYNTYNRNNDIQHLYGTRGMYESSFNTPPSYQTLNRSQSLQRYNSTAQHSSALPQHYSLLSPTHHHPSSTFQQHQPQSQYLNYHEQAPRYYRTQNF